METPQLIDKNRLAAMLGGAKKLMNKVESGNFETGNVDSTFLSVDGTQLMENDPTGGSGSNPTRKMAKITEQTISSSKLPDAIKQAMIENPIAQPSMTGPNFTLDDLPDDLIEKPMPIPQPKGRERTIQESYSQSTGLNVSENVLRAMIKDVLIEYLKTDYVKRITEDTVKTTITTLIKEGKLNVKKKVVK